MSRRDQVWTLCDKVQHDLKLAGLPMSGSATNGAVYPTIKSMWTAELGLGGRALKPREEAEEAEEAAEAAEAKRGQDESHRADGPVAPPTADPLERNPARWYERAYDYWENDMNCALDDDGILGGYGYISPIDISGSAAFIDELKSSSPTWGGEKAADCGAGIGRVTKHLLLDRFESVDIVEQSPRLLQAAPKYVGRERGRTECICLGLQDFFPATDSYDLIWVQWVVGHFTDIDFIKFINRCRAALKQGGFVIIKDNVVCEEDGAFKVDSEDSSLTRSLEYFRCLFNHGGIKIVRQQKQEGFPGEIFPVYMFALQ